MHPWLASSPASARCVPGRTRAMAVVTLFLYPDVNMRLRPKLWKELKPGTRVISHCHDMEEWKPEKRVDLGRHTVYFWIIRHEAVGAVSR